MKRLYWVLTVCLGLATIVKAAQVALTPETWAALVTVGERLLASSGFGFLLVATTCLFLLSCAAAAWERAERRDETPTRGRDLSRALFQGDPSSLVDDSQRAPLSETWAAPCGEVVRFAANPTDRGNAA